MAEGDRVVQVTTSGNQAAELRLLTVVAIHEQRFRWPDDDPIPQIVRLDMDADIQVHAKVFIDSALKLTTEREGDVVTASTFILRKDVQNWLVEVSTVLHGNGATNFKRLGDALAEAKEGRFQSREFLLLWQQLHDRVRQG